MTTADINSITGLYVTYYGRSPDQTGLDYWVGQGKANVSLESIATSFAGAPESIAKYPYLASPNTSDPTAFVRSIYLSAFGRQPEAAGLAYWVNQLKTQGSGQVPTFILTLLLNAQGTDKIALQNKSNIAAHFSNGLVTNNITGTTEIFTDSTNIVNTIDQTSGLVTAGTNITVTGDAGNYTITGGAGTDILTGGAGTDILTGGADADILTGGAGKDFFKYGAITTTDSTAATLTGTVSFDTITDFTVADDTLTLASLTTSTNLISQTTVENAIAALGGTPTFTQALTAAATAIGANKFGAFRFGSNTYVLGNDATAAAPNGSDQLIALTGNLVLTNANFGL